MRKERLARGRLVRMLRLTSLVFFIAVVSFVLVSKQQDTLISPIASPILKSVISVQDTKISDKLSMSIQDVLKNEKGEYAVVVHNLKTNENYSLNEHKVFDSGSLYKLWVLGAVFEQIQIGYLRQDQVISEEITVLNEKFNLATESAELTEGKIELPVSVALQRMITISDNYSALLLTWKLRLSKVASYMDGKGFFESGLGGKETLPTTTAYDMALFFERLYKGQLAGKESTGKMFDLLKAQQLNSKIPKLLSEGIIIAHKTGELGLVSHDAGIVYHPKGDYIIVVMSETPRPGNANEVIAKISKTVFDYFDSK